MRTVVVKDSKNATLVTGSSGMLGRVLCTHLEKSQKVLRVSRQGLDGGLRCDLSDPEAVGRLFHEHSVGLVIHTAAYSDVDGCERDPKHAYAANAQAPRNLSEVCGAKHIPWIHISTNYVFDGRKKTPYVEQDPTGPVNIYGVTKWVGEFYAKSSVSPCANVRTSWLFGGPNPKNFVNAITERIQKEDLVTVLNNQTDAPTSVKDLSLALEKIARLLREQPSERRWNETLHVCNGGVATHQDLTETIRDVLGRKNVRVEITDPAKIPNRIAIRPAPMAAMSNARFEKMFDMKLRPWRESLSEYIKSL